MEIRVELLRTSEAGAGVSKVLLSVSDTGAGLPQDVDSRRKNSLGLQLVTDLSRQLGSVLEIGPGPSLPVIGQRSGVSRMTRVETVGLRQ